MKQSENILSFAASVLMAFLLCFPLAFFLMITLFPHEGEDYWPIAEGAAALVLTIVAIPFLFSGIRNGMRRAFKQPI